MAGRIAGNRDIGRSGHRVIAGIAVIGKAKTLPLINADNTDRESKISPLMNADNTDPNNSSFYPDSQAQHSFRDSLDSVPQRLKPVSLSALPQA
jgi:hypothetical protein